MLSTSDPPKDRLLINNNIAFALYSSNILFYLL